MTYPKRRKSPMTYFQWLDNCLVVGGDIFTVKPDGTLEIRGQGWEHRKRKGDTPMTDRPRVCKFPSEAEARRIAELIAGYLQNSPTGHKS